MKKDNWRFEALARAKIVQQEEEKKAMTTDQKENYRLGFFTCLSIMREMFLQAARTPENDEEIGLYLEANDRAHELLSKITQDGQEIAE